MNECARSKARHGKVTLILLNLCVSLTILLIVLYAAEQFANSRIGCRVANIIRYYLVLVSLFWNGIEAHNMYRMLVKVFNAGEQSHFVLKAAIVAWGKLHIQLVDINGRFWTPLHPGTSATYSLLKMAAEKGACGKRKWSKTGRLSLHIHYGNVTTGRIRGHGVVRCVSIVTSKDGQHPIHSINKRSGLRLGLGLGLVVGLGLGLIIPTCRTNRVLRVILQCDIFGMTPVWVFMSIELFRFLVC